MHLHIFAQITGQVEWMQNFCSVAQGHDLGFGEEGDGKERKENVDHGNIEDNEAV